MQPVTDIATRTDQPLPWEKQPKESRQAFQAFQMYRDLGYARSQAKVAAALGKSEDLIARWSSRWRWVERADAVPRPPRPEAREARETAIKQLNDLEQAFGHSAMVMALQRLRGDRNAEEPVTALDPNQLEPNDVMRLASDGSRLMRLAYGEPTDLVKNALLIHPTDVSRQIGAVVDVALKFIPDDLQAAFLRELEGSQ